MSCEGVLAVTCVSCEGVLAVMCVVCEVVPVVTSVLVYMLGNQPQRTGYVRVLTVTVHVVCRHGSWKRRDQWLKKTEPN